MARSKNVVSYSLWGGDTLYTHGALRAVAKCREFYPGWEIRFYYDSATVPKHIVSALRDYQKDGDVVLIDKAPLPGWMGLFWRFEPMFDDDSVLRFIVRDTDSVPCAREVGAVKEWIDSEELFHIMRDNPSHGVTMLGGTWGALAGCVPDFEQRMRSWFTTMRPDYRNPRGPFHGSDQEFLHNCVWQFAKDSHIAHDEYHTISGARARPFPSQRIGNTFIGMTE
jgi:hypothetical protein